MFMVRLFQSAPRALARGDLRHIEQRRSMMMFQSAPRALARGDITAQAGQTSIRPVSIRAPCTRTGRPKREKESISFIGFQSAPRALARGDSTSYRATPLNDDVSIRAPCTRTGRLTAQLLARSP